MVRRSIVICAVALIPAAAAADSLPPGVTLVARGTWGGGTSPDGALFAHFTGMKTRKLAIETIATGKSATIATDEKSCSDSACLDNRCGRIEWSHDGARLAMRTDDGLWEVDVAAKTRRRVDTDERRASCEFRFAADGPLEWLGPGTKSTALWRDGDDASIVELPKAANATEIGDTVVVTGRWASEGYGAGWTDLWIVDRTHRKIRRIYHRDADDDSQEVMAEPKLSPDESRVCWLGTAVHCTLTRTGKDEVLAEAGAGRRGAWGHERTLPFSPSGRLLAFRVAGDDGADTLMVHDFTTGETRDVLAPMRHQDYAFWGEDRIVLYEQEDAKDATIPAIELLDLTDGSETAIVTSPETQYNAPVLPAGRTDIFYIGRERPHSGSRDLVKIDVAAAAKGAD